VNEEFNDFRNRYIAKKALAKYVRVRLASEFSSIGESAIVWLIDAERALSTLDELDREIIITRVLGFTVSETARITHRGKTAVERRSARAERQLADAFLANNIISKSLLEA
jgi:DNA-directed RNA polymerase specialized sigma24 family protein